MFRVLFSRENGPAWLEEGGHFPFNSQKKTFGIAAGSKGLKGSWWPPLRGGVESRCGGNGLVVH